MINNEEAKILAIIAMANKFGRDYVKNHHQHVRCTAWNENVPGVFEYFVAFEESETENKWTVFADTRIDKNTEEVIFLDYRTPEGERMGNPVRKVRCA